MAHNKMKLAVLSDLHFTQQDNNRRTEYSDLIDVFLLRAVHRLNHLIKPDATVLLGDLLQDPNGENDVFDTMKKLKGAVDKLTMPAIALPGNQDLPADEFFKIFPPPPRWLDVKGVRLVPFIDQPMPACNAFRPPKEMEKMRQAGRNWSGPLLSLHHVPLFEPGKKDCPYNYVNAAEILPVMKEFGYCLALGGHYHLGIEPDNDDQVASVACPAFCDQPFSFLIIEISEDKTVEVQQHQLQLPEELALVDNHIHTGFAYCSENMDITRSLRIIRAMNLANCRFTEHSGQLYFDAETFWQARFMEQGVDTAEKKNRRMDEYFMLINEHNIPSPSQGLEIDCDFRGRPVLTEDDRSKTGFMLGAMHWLPATQKNKQEFNNEQAGRELLCLAEKFLSTGLTVLAHPFRIFSRSLLSPPAAIFEKLARLLRRHNVAAELNFHTQEPPEEFVRICLELGVKLSLGSDAHNLYEVGELYPHLQLLRRLGVGNSDLPRILVW